MKAWLGLMRSLIVYWRPGRQRALRALYRPFVGLDDLVFDVGAHLGDRSVAFAALGARVIALEPQPRVARWLRRLVARRGRITVLQEAVGRQTGIGELAISRRTPAVSTLAHGWRSRLPEANSSFKNVRWDDTATVTITTLDAMIATHGLPAFCKIDVEGHEAEVLAGLSQPLPGLSFEFVAGALEVAADCIGHLGRLGRYEFNAIAVEERRYLFDAWRSSDEVAQWLAAGAGGSPSGDLYAVLVHPSSGRLPNTAGVFELAEDGAP